MTSWTAPENNAISINATSISNDEKEKDRIFLSIPLNWVEEHRGYTLLLAFCCSLLATLISIYNIHQHLSHYGRPHLQRYIVRILGIVPVYAIGSWLSLRFVDQAIYFDTLRDCYEAFVIYSFLTLVLAFAGGENMCVTKIQSQEPMKHPIPLCCLTPIVLNGRFVRICKRGTIQFVFIKPIAAFISLVMLAIGKYHSTSYQLLLFIVYNTSYTLALYCLLLFYMATKTVLKSFRPVGKFLAVKGVIFLTYTQSFVIKIIPGITPSEAFAWNDLILCIEMVLFALFHSWSFSARQFKIQFNEMPEAEVLKNIKEVLSVTDIVSDALHSFKPAYQDYMLQRNDEEWGTKTSLVHNTDGDAFSPTFEKDIEPRSCSPHNGPELSKVPNAALTQRQTSSIMEEYLSTRLEDSEDEDDVQVESALRARKSPSITSSSSSSSSSKTAQGGKDLV